MQILRNHTMLQGEDRLHQAQMLRRPTGLCPKLVFTGASAHGPSMPYTSARLAYSMGSPTGVPVPCASTMPTVPASTPAAANAGLVDRDLRGPRRCRDVHGVAVLVGGRAAHHSQDPVTIAQRVRQPLEQHHDATLADTNPSAATSNA